jgi:hypothetical protein
MNHRLTAASSLIARSIVYGDIGTFHFTLPVT